MTRPARGPGRLSAMALLAFSLVLPALAAGEAIRAPGATPPAAEALSRLGWLAGRWSGEADGQQMEEVWMAASGGTMLGMHRDVSSGSTVSFEFLRIAVEKERLVYWASPQGRTPTPFAMAEWGPGNRVVFENPEHDFPRRILYWLDGEQALHARVEGPKGSAEKPMEWVWRKSGI